MAVVDPNYVNQPVETGSQVEDDDTEVLPDEKAGEAEVAVETGVELPAPPT